MNEKKPYSKAIVFLLKKTVENNSPVWNDIITYQKDIQNYLSDIGLELVIKKDEGFAYLKQFALDDDNTLSLVQRRQLSFEVSILLIVLRQVLEDFDNNPTDTHSIDKIISNNEIKDEVRMFLPEKYDKVKFERYMGIINDFRIDAHAKDLDEEEQVLLNYAFKFFEEALEIR